MAKGDNKLPFLQKGCKPVLGSRGGSALPHGEVHGFATQLFSSS